MTNQHIAAGLKTITSSVSEDTEAEYVEAWLKLNVPDAESDFMW